MVTEQNGLERKENGTFGPGNKFSAGRGANKVSTKVKESIVKFLEDNVDQIQESFDKLKPSDKLRFIAEILPYAAPKLSAIQVEQETKLSGGISITWEEPELQAGQGQSSN